MTLVLIRHGKSDWTSGTEDFMRPLNKRGLRDAPMMAEELKKRGIVPGRMITSPALRALTTAQLMADSFGCPPPEEKSSLYLASASEILTLAFRELDSTDCLFLFGHNPGMSYAVSGLMDTMTSMPTCAAAVLELSKKDDSFTLENALVLRPKEILSI